MQRAGLFGPVLVNGANRRAAISEKDSPSGDPYMGRARLRFPSAFALGRSSTVLSSSNRNF